MTACRSARAAERSFKHSFPADGEYRITLTDLDVGLYPRSLETEHTLVMLLDRDEVFRAKLGGPEDLALVDRGGAPARARIMQRFADIPVQVTAGVHEVVVTFIERARASTDEPIFGFTPYGGFSFTGMMRVPRVIGGIQLAGPFDHTACRAPQAAQKIFVCQPETDGRRARVRAAHHREPSTPRVPPAGRAGRCRPPHAVLRSGPCSARVASTRASSNWSPPFSRAPISSIARSLPPQDAGASETHALNDFELASRLSFFLWSQGPDDELLELAAAGKLRGRGVLQAQVAAHAGRPARRDRS